MKNYLGFFVVYLIALTSGKAQMTWSKSIDYNFESNYGYSVLEYKNDEYVAAGVTYPFDKPAGVILKVNYEGELVWEQSLTFENQSFYLYKAFKIFDSQIWSTGLVSPGSSVASEPAIVVYDDNGTELFRKVYDFSPFVVNFNKGIRALNDTTIMIIFDGFYQNQNEEYFHQYGFLLTDTLGNEIDRKWLPSNFDISFPLAIVPFPNGGFMQSIVEIEHGQGIPFEYPLTIKRLDDTFGVIWQKTLPKESASAGRFAFDKNSNIYVTWTEDPADPGVGSAWGKPAIISYTSNGEFRWKYNFDDNLRLRLLGYLIVNSEENIIAVGLDEPGFDPLQWGWMVCLDTNGNLLWDRKYTIEGISPNFGGTFGNLIETSDSSLLVVGYIHDKYPLDNFIARENIWLLKTDLNGCVIDNECDDYSSLTSFEKIDLETSALIIFPNPVSDLLYFNFISPTDFQITVYSGQGARLQSFSGFGFNTELQMSSLPNGMYFIHTQTPHHSFVNKVVVSK